MQGRTPSGCCLSRSTGSAGEATHQPDASHHLAHGMAGNAFDADPSGIGRCRRSCAGTTPPARRLSRQICAASAKRQPLRTASYQSTPPRRFPTTTPLPQVLLLLPFAADCEVLNLHVCSLFACPSSHHRPLWCILAGLYPPWHGIVHNGFCYKGKCFNMSVRAMQIDPWSAL